MAQTKKDSIDINPNIALLERVYTSTDAAVQYRDLQLTPEPEPDKLHFPPFERQFFGAKNIPALLFETFLQKMVPSKGYNSVAVVKKLRKNIIKVFKLSKGP